VSVHIHGHLAPTAASPTEGETTVELARAASFTVEQILSGRLDAPQRYQQDHDEWVVVLAGGAQLEVDGVAHDLVAGDWWLFPAGTAHTLVQTEPGTSWLAVRSTR
jgi:cupin 2 domain-containing protein